MSLSVRLFGDKDKAVKYIGLGKSILGHIHSIKEKTKVPIYMMYKKIGDVEFAVRSIGHMDFIQIKHPFPFVPKILKGIEEISKFIYCIGCWYNSYSYLPTISLYKDNGDLIWSKTYSHPSSTSLFKLSGALLDKEFIYFCGFEWDNWSNEVMIVCKLNLEGDEVLRYTHSEYDAQTDCNYICMGQDENYLYLGIFELYNWDYDGRIVIQCLDKKTLGKIWEISEYIGTELYYEYNLLSIVNVDDNRIAISILIYDLNAHPISKLYIIDKINGTILNTLISEAGSTAYHILGVANYKNYLAVIGQYGTAFYTRYYYRLKLFDLNTNSLLWEQNLTGFRPNVALHALNPGIGVDKSGIYVSHCGSYKTYYNSQDGYVSKYNFLGELKWSTYFFADGHNAQGNLVLTDEYVITTAGIHGNSYDVLPSTTRFFKKLSGSLVKSIDVCKNGNSIGVFETFHKREI